MIPEKPKCKKLDAVILSQMDDDSLADAVAHLASWRIAHDLTKSNEILESMGQGFVVVASVWLFEAHFMCEGFSCYFGNTEQYGNADGKTAETVIRSYGTLGLPEASKIIEEALEIWREELAQRSLDFDEEASKRREQLYRTLDIKFGEAGIDDISKNRMAEYVREHPHEFEIDITNE